MADASSIAESLTIAGDFESRVRRQRTIAQTATVSGVGLFTNAETTVRFLPADADRGIVFRRTDGDASMSVAAHIAHLEATPRRTSLGTGGRRVEMVEHTLAALAGLQIDNVIVEVDGPEIPGLDGSSQPTVHALLAAGIFEQDAERATITITQRVEVSDGRGATIVAEPADVDGLDLTYELDHPAPVVGRQSAQCVVTPTSFAEQIASARTFVLAEEVTALRAAGYGLKLTERDLCVFAPDGVIDNELRFDNEPARHKLLDCVGDFALAGCDIVGRIVASRSGHALNHAFVRELLNTHSASVPSFTRRLVA